MWFNFNIAMQRINDHSTKLETSGQLQIKCLSPYGFDILLTVGQYLPLFLTHYKGYAASCRVNLCYQSGFIRYSAV